jgi:hypothetical protein
MAIYKPSPAPGGEPYPHRIAVAFQVLALRILCSQTGTELAALDGPDPPTSVTTHHRPDGRPVIVTRSELNYVWAWDGDDYHLVFKRSLGLGLRLQHLYTYAEPEEGRLRVIAVERAQTPRLFVLDGDTGETLHTLVLEEQMHCVGGYVWSDGDGHQQDRRRGDQGPGGGGRSGGGADRPADAGPQKLQRGAGLLRVG